MNALDACHVSRREGPGADAFASEAPSVAATDTAARAALPVVARTGQPHLTGPDGTYLVAGVTWEVASGPEIPVLRKGAPPVLRLPARRAFVPDPDAGAAEPCGALLLAMADALTRNHPESAGAWAFLAELPVGRSGEGRGPGCVFWIGIADIEAPDGTDATEGTPVAVTPRPGPEQVFDDPDEALAALNAHLATTDLAGLAVTWSPDRHLTERGRIIHGLAHIAPALTLHDLDPTRASGLPAGAEKGGARGDEAAEDKDFGVSVLPVFTPPRQVPVRLLGGLATGAISLLAVALLVPPLFETPPAPPPEMVSVRVAPGAFAEACTEALDGWWPRITGWRAESAGCAMAGHLPGEPDLPEPLAAGPARAMVIWRHLAPDPGRNSVLARAAADQVIDTWSHEARIDAGHLTLWQTAALPLVPAAGGDNDLAPPPEPDATRARLAALWADAPDAVTRPGGRDAAGEVFTVRTSGAEPAALILSRADRVPAIAPVRLVQSAAGGGSTELVLAPVTAREVPAALFFPTEGGPSL